MSVSVTEQIVQRVAEEKAGLLDEWFMRHCGHTERIARYYFHLGVNKEIVVCLECDEAVEIAVEVERRKIRVSVKLHRSALAVTGATTYAR